jgi:hypothetical protein
MPTVRRSDPTSQDGRLPTVHTQGPGSTKTTRVLDSFQR